MENKKLYRVCGQGGNVVMGTAEIVRETDKTIIIKNALPGRAFDWRTRLMKKSDLICRTPREAIDAFIKRQQLIVDRARNDMGNARRYIEQAQHLPASALSGDSSDTSEMSGVSS